MPSLRVSLSLCAILLAAPVAAGTPPGEAAPTAAQNFNEASLDELLDVPCSGSFPVSYSAESNRGEILVTPLGEVLKSTLGGQFDENDTLVVKVLGHVGLLPRLSAKRLQGPPAAIGSAGVSLPPKLRRQVGALSAVCGVREFALTGFKPGQGWVLISVRQGTRLQPLGTFDIDVKQPWWRSIGWPWVAGLVAFAGSVVLGWLRAKRAEREKQEAVRALERLRLQTELDRPGVSAPTTQRAEETGAEAAIAQEVLDDLVTACVAEACVLFTGAGLPVQAGYPTMSEILGNLLERASERGNRDLQREILTALRDGRYAEVSELLALRLPKDAIVEGVEACFPSDPPPLPEAYESLRRIPFAGAISNSWDSLVEKAFRLREPVVVFPTRSESSSPSMLEDTFVIAKPYGSVQEKDTFLFTPGEALQAVRSNPVFSRLLATLAGRNSVFYVGASLETIQGFLSSIQFRADLAPRHFALVPRTADWSLQVELLASRFGVRLLGYVPSPGFPEVGKFLAFLADEVKKIRPSAAPPSPIGKATLSEVKLENIGPFKSLTLQLNPQWNILLGNNGSGKSTLLRAIALGLCGDDEEAARSAWKLLRVGESSGSIQLTMGNIIYQTRLTSDNTKPPKVRVESAHFTALQKGSWVVLGFPPLRGVSTRNPDGPGNAGSPMPTVEDLLPLIRGTTDQRLNDLKQWIVNVDAGTRSKDASVAARHVRLRDSFFDLLRKVTPGVRIEFGQVQDATWQVLVKTDDGLVPIDQVSQGMSSIFGWVGTMLQRMYEIHASAPQPELEPALVLVDEIEAHLHPEWQQRIIGIIREYFPNLQIVATSHSPLLVAGMRASEVFIASRDFDDPAELSVSPAPIEFEGLRADQILTSPLFGLVTTRSDQTRQDVRIYSDLKAKQLRAPSSLTPEEAAKLGVLREKLLNVLRPEESRVEQLAADAVSETLRRMADPAEMAKHLPDGQLSPEIKYELRRRLETIMPAASEDENDTHRQAGT
jgi:energy-coupling factor transporter ATP-binding protein EcfA2